MGSAAPRRPAPRSARPVRACRPPLGRPDRCRRPRGARRTPAPRPSRPRRSCSWSTDPTRRTRCRPPCGPRCARRRTRRGTRARSDRPSDSSTSTPASSCAKPVTSRSRWIGTPSSATQPARMRSKSALPEREPVVVAGREVADVERDAGEALDLHRPVPRRGTARRCRADRAPRSCASAGRRRASPSSSWLGAPLDDRRRRRPPAPARPPASARSGRLRRSPPRARS